MRSGMLVAIAAATGCGVGATTDDARDVFVERAWPALTACVGCHQAQPSVDFLAPGTPEEAYDTLFAFQPPVIDLGSPASSLLVTMGRHTGPALAPVNATAVLDWIDAERAARIEAPPPPLAIGPITLVLGTTNSVDLGPLGAPGAVVRFVPTALGESGLAINDLELVAGPAAIHVAHPLVVTNPAQHDPIPDPLDQLADVDTIVAAGTALALGDALLVGFRPTDPLSIHVRALEVLP